MKSKAEKQHRKISETKFWFIENVETVDQPLRKQGKKESKYILPIIIK